MKNCIEKPMIKYGMAAIHALVNKLRGNEIEKERFTSASAISNTVSSVKIHTILVPIPLKRGTRMAVNTPHTITPAMPALTIARSFLIGINNCCTIIFALPIMMSCTIMIRMSLIAPSKPSPAKRKIMSGENISTKHISGREKRNKNLNDFCV